MIRDINPNPAIARITAATIDTYIITVSIGLVLVRIELLLIRIRVKLL